MSRGRIRRPAIASVRSSLMMGRLLLCATRSNSVFDISATIAWLPGPSFDQLAQRHPPVPASAGSSNAILWGRTISRSISLIDVAIVRGRSIRTRTRARGEFPTCPLRLGCPRRAAAQAHQELHGACGDVLAIEHKRISAVELYARDETVLREPMQEHRGPRCESGAPSWPPPLDP